MDKTLWTEIGNKIKPEMPRYGNITIDLIFHDGRMAYYSISRNDKFKVDNSSALKDKE